MLSAADATTAPTGSATPRAPGTEWWRSAVIYQVYPRSFADGDGDGIGDLPGVADHLPALAELGVDAVWLSPFYPSPQHDAGYDVSDYRDVDPRFGTLADFDRLLDGAHDLGLKVVVDLVPNHTSSEHPWFRAALAAEPGTAPRRRYLFRDGRGEHGELPPNDWQSVFGGDAWTRVPAADGSPGQWYLHLFDTSQPDLNWDDPGVRDEFDAILRYWLDRGVDGFRVDVAHGLVKAPGLPDWREPAPHDDEPEGPPLADAVTSDDAEPVRPGRAPYWAQPGVHDIYRRWHEVAAAYPGDRVFVAEAWVDPVADIALFVRPDELQQAFNFIYLQAPWEAGSIRTAVQESLAVFERVGAPSTWVLSNHDVVRHASRLALPPGTAVHSGLGPRSPERPDPALGLRRARAATAIMLALPGSAYLYQGEELGLPEVIDLPDEVRQDPTFLRTHGERYGRDGCRVPLPWERAAPAYGFSPSGQSWLPQPIEWAELARDLQTGAQGSTLELYRRALRLRREHGLGLGAVEWLTGYPESVVAFRNGHVTVLANLGDDPVPLPPAEVLLATSDATTTLLAPDTAAWLRADRGDLRGDGSRP